MTFSSSDSIEKFFDTIWREKEGLIYLPTAGKDGDWKKSFFEWPKHRQHIVTYVERNAAAGREVYFSPVLYSKPKPTKDYIIGSNVIWADFDGNAPESWDPDPSEPATALSAPSMRVQSSTTDRQHAYWVLDEFISSVSVLEAMNRSIAYKLKADPSCWDSTQLLRPPGTINYGYAKKRNSQHDVHIVDLTDQVYQNTAFAPTEDYRDQIKLSLSETEIPPVDKVLILRTWDERFYDLFNKDLRGTKGNRSDSLMALAYMGAENGLTDNEIYSVINDADIRWDLYTRRTNRAFLLSDIIARARAKYPFSDPNEFAFLSTLDSSETELAPKNDYGFGEIIASELKIEWLFTGLLSTMGYGLVYGTPGIGKTQIAVRMGMALALGRDYLNWENATQTPKRVYFFSLEMDFVEIKSMYEVMAGSIGDEDKAVLSENFRTNTLGEPIPLDKPEGRKYFEKSIQEANPEIILIDSYSDASHGSVSNDDTVRELVRYLRGIRKKFRVAIYIIHHDKKAQGTDPKSLTNTFDKMYGSRYLSAKADFVLSLVYTKEGDLVLSEEKKRLDKKNNPILIQRNEYLDFEQIGEINEGQVSHSQYRGTSNDRSDDWTFDSNS